MHVFLILLFLPIMVVESTVLQVPLTLVTLLLLFSSTKSSRIFLYAYIAGVLLDLLLLRRIGMSSMFFVVFLFLLSLYDKKYEINSGFFVLLAGFVGSLCFSYVFGYQRPFLQAILGALIAAVGFIVGQTIFNPTRKTS